ncbi:MAG: hypothetical protein DME63_00255 [Verrucomicrobia bacterium]|nr:MAG: hypothetical protein DME63_00255 [Verrucomicrobiota bacterium]
MPAARGDIPWPEVVQRLAYENEKLARRPGGHAGEYFIVCTLYYTSKESGFTFERGFDATRITKPGLHGRTYPRDFLRSVKKEGYGRIVTPVNGHNYIRYNGGDSYGYSSAPSGGSNASSAARAGKLWTPAAVCAAGSSIVTTAKTNRSVPENSWRARARPLLSMLTRSRE